MTGKFWKNFRKFLKNGEKDTPFFENFPKEINRIANFGTVSYRGPPPCTYFLKVSQIEIKQKRVYFLK